MLTLITKKTASCILVGFVGMALLIGSLLTGLWLIEMAFKKIKR